MGLRTVIGGRMAWCCFLLSIFVGVISVAGGDPFKTPWTEAPAKLPSGRYGAAAVVSGDSIYLVGGSQAEHDAWHAHPNPIKDVLKYEKGEWKAVASLKHARYLPAVALVDNFIYVFGGIGIDGGETKFLSSGEKLDINHDDNVWEPLTDMESARCCFQAAVFKEKIYLYGGSTHEDRGARNDWLLYDPDSNSWLTDDRLTNGKENRTSYGLAQVGDHVYFFGGLTEGNQFGLAIQDIARYDLGSNTWEPEWSSFSEGRSGAAVVVTKDESSAYIIGGISGTSMEPLNSVEMVKFGSSPDWRNASDLRYGRLYHSAVLLGNTILVIGGWGPKRDGDLYVRDDVEVMGVNAKTDLPEHVHDVNIEPDEGRDRGWWIVFGILGAFALYFAVGIAIKYRQGARGGEMVPHREFWVELPTLVQEGGVIAFDFGRGVVQRFRSRQEYRPLSTEEQDDEEALDTSRLSARPSARGAYGGVTA